MRNIRSRIAQLERAMERNQSPDVPRQSFKVGDVVRLKSGGADMVVTRVGQDGFYPVTPGYVLCQWMDNQHQMESYTLPEAALELAKKEPLL